MRTHTGIIADAGGDTALGNIIGAPAGNVKQWRRNDSIPAPYWQAISDHGLASLEELAAHAARRVAAANDSQPQEKAA